MLWGFQPEPPAPGPRSRLPGEGPGPHPHPGPSSPVTSKRPSRSRPGRAATSKDNGECAQEPPLRPHGEGPATRRATARGLSPPPWLTALRSRRTLRAAGANTGCGEAPGWALGKPPPGLTPLRVGRAGTTQGRGRSTKGCSARTAAVAAVRHLTHCLEQAPSATAPPGRHSSGRADPDATGWGGQQRRHSRGRRPGTQGPDRCPVGTTAEDRAAPCPRSHHCLRARGAAAPPAAPWWLCVSPARRRGRHRRFPGGEDWLLCKDTEGLSSDKGCVTCRQV